MPFKVDINGKNFQLVCPPNAGPGLKVKMVVVDADAEISVQQVVNELWRS
jgi:hypothetical protein